jgi:hypothetical protein
MPSEGFQFAPETELRLRIEELRAALVVEQEKRARLMKVLREVGRLVGDDCDCHPDYGPCVRCTIAPVIREDVGTVYD